jgi:DNA-binding protein HU-beta
MPNATYGKTALIDDVTASTTGYTRKAVTEILETALNTIQKKVQEGQRVTLTGFGTWQQSQRAARMGTNIRTKQKIQIPASRSVRWTPGSEFKAAVSGRSSQGRYTKERSR